MDRFVKKKRKNTSKPLQRPISPDRSTNVAVGSSGFRAESDGGVKGNGGSQSSQIVTQDDASGLRASSVGISGTASNQDFTILCQTDEETTNIGVGDTEPSRTTQKSPFPEGASGGCDVTKEAAKRFGPLKAVLEAIPAAYANEKKAAAIGNKIEDLLSRIVGLEECFDWRPSDIAEQRRRGELQREFEGIKEQLQSQLETVELQTNRISELLEDLRESILDYQMVRQREIDDKLLHEMDPAEATALNNFCSAQRAEYRHGDRVGCLKGTRGAVLDEIELWTKDFRKPPIYWLNGLAGTGKTTIAQTVAERTFADGKLGASFFCSRDFEDRSNLHFIFPTIAVQLARKYPDFRSVFVPLVRSDPGIAYESLYNQFHRLIVKPLLECAVSTVVIVDALDECKDEESTSAILSVLGQLVSEVPKVKFFITGRPEPRIREGFRLPLLSDAANVFVLHEVERSQVEGDIRLFFRHKFSELACHRPCLDGWPTEEELGILCERAAGLFVYAAATVKFVDKQSGNPRRQLDLLLRSPGSSVREAKTRFRDGTTLDSLYLSILQEAFGDDDDPDNDPKFRSVLGAMVIAANPLSPSTIAMLLDLDTEDVFPLLSSAQSLLILREDVYYPVQPFHKSFPDFITDPKRCTDQRFHVSPPSHHLQLLICSLDLMDRMLKKNMCKLPEIVANSDVSDLTERIERYLDPALQYACKSWHSHLVAGRSTSKSTPQIASALHRFLEKKLLFWLEVLSVLGAVRNALDALQAVVDWLEESPTLDLASDCSRFVSGCFEVINASSSHIYHSALASTPKTSTIWKLYKSHARPFTRVVHGVPSSWDSTAAVTTRPLTIRLAAWSPSSKFIAITQGDPVVVDILDSATLQRLQSLRVAQARRASPRALIFSPDDQMLSCSGLDNWAWRVVLTWDLQTGGVVSDVVWRGNREAGEESHCITYSTDGKMVGVLHRNGVTATISIFDVVSGVHIHDIYPHTPRAYTIWTHGESLRFATTQGAAITIQEVGFTRRVTAVREIETLSVPSDADQAEVFDPEAQEHLTRTQFFPALCRVAFTRVSLAPADELLVWDTQNSVSLLHSMGTGWHPRMTFSSDGRFFACSTTGVDVYLWKESSTGYTLIGRLSATTQCSTPLLSPNGESIITFGGSTIQLWHTKYFTAPSSILAQVPHNAEDFVLEFIPDRQLAVVARREEKTVTILSLESGLPQLIIDASMKVHGLRVVENAVVVIGDGKIISWRLPEGDSLPPPRVGVDSGTQTTYTSSGQRGGVTAASISLDLRYVALLRRGPALVQFPTLHIYCLSTGRHDHATLTSGTSLWFAPGGHDIWCAAGSGAAVRTIDRSGLQHRRFEPDIERLPSACPWRSFRGYKVTDDGWLIGPDGRRLFMLPPPWRSCAVQRVWSGQFLALLHGALPQPVILELAP